jgi:putative colanic acid biosynthesis UDP-glucose lipid carrier transferase
MGRLYDICVIAGALLAMHAIAHGLRFRIQYYLPLALISAMTFQLMAEATSLYRSYRSESCYREAANILKIWTLTILLLLAVGFAAKITALYSRVLLMLWTLLVPLCLCLSHAAVRFLLRSIRHLGLNYRRIAVVGFTDVTHEVIRQIQTNASLGMRLAGIYGEDNTRDDAFMSEYKGTVQVLLDDVRAGNIDTVYVTLPLSETEKIDTLIRQLADSTVDLYLVPGFATYDLFRSPISMLGNLPTLSVYDSPLTVIDVALKQAADMFVASLALVVTGIPMCLIALAVKWTSKGPILFRQRRYGVGGNEICIWKFRTMNVCEDSSDTITQAQKEDPRVTRFGRFLRRTSLDELPQLFNVLQGSMSMVGPRPHAVAHNEEYRKLIHGYMLRHKVKPGITGLAQIRGHRGKTDTLDKMQKRLDSDLEYIRNWSVSLDFKILLLTFFVGFNHKNAY